MIAINCTPLREQAIALRLAGKSLREIRQALPPMSNTTLNEWLRETPPPDWTRRPNAKDEVHAEAAQRFWEGVTGAPADQFGNPTLKRHNPKTVRKNIGEGYHGCLRVEVRRSAEFYRRIEGWVAGITSCPALSGAPATQVS